MLRISIRGADENSAADASSVLKSEKFEVLDWSRRGIDVRAPKEVIESFFKVRVADSHNPHFVGEPNFDKMPQGLSFAAYFPTKPKYF